MDLDNKNNRLLVLLIASLVTIAFLIFNSYPKKSDLIVTPSTHKEIEFLKVEGYNLGNNKVEFAVYDNECNYYEICTLIRDGDDTSIFNGLERIKIYADGNEVTSYNFLLHNSVWKNNIILLIKIPKAEELMIDYNDDRVTIR